MTKPLYAILYARFSPRSKSAECPSCDVQLADLREWCATRSITIIAEYRDDALSGADTGRAGLRAALAFVKRGQLFLCRSFDRISRNTHHMLGVALDLAKRGVQLESITQGRYDPEDEEFELLFTILAGVAQYQRRKIKKATSQKMLSHQAGGRRMSKIPPFGFAVDPEDETRLLPFDEEQPTVDRIKQLHSEGVGLLAIGRQLHSEGKSCRGGQWHYNTIKRILARAKALQ